MPDNEIMKGAKAKGFVVAHLQAHANSTDQKNYLPVMTPQARHPGARALRPSFSFHFFPFLFVIFCSDLNLIFLVNIL